MKLCIYVIKQAYLPCLYLMFAFFTTAIFTVYTCRTKNFTLKPIYNKHCFEIGLTEHFAHFGLKFQYFALALCKQNYHEILKTY